MYQAQSQRQVEDGHQWSRKRSEGSCELLPRRVRKDKEYPLGSIEFCKVHDGNRACCKICAQHHSSVSWIDVTATVGCR